MRAVVLFEDPDEFLDFVLDDEASQDADTQDAPVFLSQSQDGEIDESQDSDMSIKSV